MAKKVNDLFFMRPWAIEEDALHVISEVLTRHSEGIKLSKEEIAAAIGNKKDKTTQMEIQNGVAMIPIQGVITKKYSWINDVSFGGGASTEQIKKDIQAAIEDKSVHTIALNIDSPGGSVDGVPELADFISAAKKKKKIYAYTDGDMASAAYWIGSSADKVFATVASRVGSIGVYSVVQDWTVANHNAGLKTEVIKAGKDKAAGHPDKPFTEDDRAVFQKQVNTFYKMFTDAVKKNRKMTDSKISEVATGRVFIGEQALEAGLIDGIDSIDSILSGDVSGSFAAGAHKISGENQEPEPSTGPETEEFQTREGNQMALALESLKLEELKMARPDLCVALKNEGIAEGTQAEATKQAADAKAKADSEKARVTAILAKAIEIKDVDDAALACIKSGETVEAAENTMKAAKLDKLKNAGPAALGGGNAGESVANANETLEERADREWKSEPKIKEEFSSKDVYLGWLKAEASGRVSILGEKKKK